MSGREVTTLVRDTASTLWVTALAFLTLALPAHATLGDAPDTLWLQIGCAVALGLGFGLRRTLRAGLRRAAAAWAERERRRAPVGPIVMVLAERPRR
jgi:hypothetical protein